MECASNFDKTQGKTSNLDYLRLKSISLRNSLGNVFLSSIYMNQMAILGLQRSFRSEGRWAKI
jgi:hypothetical protein